MNDDVTITEAELPAYEHLYDMTDSTPVAHRFDRIIGNQLMCSMHNSSCPSLTIKPTEVLEYDSKGQLVLVDKAP